MMKKKGQISAEFISVVMSATIMVFVFLVVFSEMHGDNLKEKKEILSRDFIYSIQNEFIVAASAKDGYTRSFEVPYNLEGFDYEIDIDESYVTINYSENILGLPIPDAKGYLVKGNNVITKKNNTICVNC